MFSPAITDIATTLKNPAGMFRTLADVELELDLYGDPRVAVGDDFAIFDCRVDGAPMRLKVFLSGPAEARDGETRRAGEMYVHTLAGDEGWVDVFLTR